MGGLVKSVANIFTGADQTQAAANTAAEQQRTAAQAAAFRPVGMTTRFGSAQFERQTDPATGLPYVSSAGYTPAPELSALQERLFGTFGQGLTAAEQMQRQAGDFANQATNLYNLGSSYLASSPEQARQDYITQQQALLAPQQEQTLAGIRNKLYQSGRTGLATGGTAAGNMQATNPEMAAYYNSLAQQQAQLAAGAEAAAQQRQQFGAGLLGTGTQLQQAQQQTLAGAYSPLQALLGVSGNVENLAQIPYQMGVQLGTAQIPGQTAYQQGMTQAANTQYQGAAAANAANAGFWSGLMSGGAQAYGAYKR